MIVLHALWDNPARAETIKCLIQPFVLRRMKTDPTIVNDLSEKMEMNIFCNLSQEQATLYEAVVREMLEKIEDSLGFGRQEKHWIPSLV